MSKILDRIEKGDEIGVSSLTACISTPGGYYLETLDGILFLSYFIDGYNPVPESNWDETIIGIVLTVIFNDATVECEKFDSLEKLKKFSEEIKGKRR